MNKLDWDCLYCSRINPYYIYSCVGCSAPKQRCRERGVKKRDAIECPDPNRPGAFIEVGKVNVGISADEFSDVIKAKWMGMSRI